jgi:transcriptional regulator with XRE-family HTH domain
VQSGSYREPDPNLLAFGLKIRLLRAGRRLTQEQLAHEAGLHRTVVGFIERGERDVGISTLWRLAPALGVSIADLFADLSKES